MPRILTISSQVVRGHVGNSAAGFSLTRLGHEVWQLPTIILSNHPGHAHCAALPIEVGKARDMMQALEANGWLSEIDAVMSGYLPTIDHVALVGDLVRRLRRRRELFYLCDPILGDEPKGLYINADAADAIRRSLVPIADVATPNWFELNWMIDGAGSDDRPFEQLAEKLGPKQVLVTSLPASSERQLSNALYVRDPTNRLQDRVWTVDVPRLANAPHGTGDFLAALYLGHLMNARPPTEAMAAAVAGVKAALLASTSSDELCLVGSQQVWVDPPDIVAPRRACETHKQS